ncbi:hypothetical protein PILCRDRAFT_13410 [Piloderma croceum F 1598]|uniref:Uncharacterized protein n=1 Tax=Piloderma croceum (strain F 1598) TaxID=765440 RepID=A0A0C3ESY7_PILCF|nr:hypothetical protein PILCRDRAFT_13410 [Piloderma croceum F 1598]
MTNPSSAYTTTTDDVEKATVDRSLVSDSSCPQVNPLYPQNQLSEFEPVMSLISWLPPQVLAKLNISSLVFTGSYMKNRTIEGLQN